MTVGRDHALGSFFAGSSHNSPPVSEIRRFAKRHVGLKELLRLTPHIQGALKWQM
jgi:hypothetical protein